MHITDYELFVVGNPPPRYGGRYFIFVKLMTNNGIIGYGEIYAATFHPNVVSAMAADIIERYVINKNPHNIENIWRNVYGSGYSLRPDISLMGVLSGIEIALWDIIGKAQNKPVYMLLGGLVNERLRTYSYLYPPTSMEHDSTSMGAFYNDAILSAEQAALMVKEGFSAIKFDPAGPYTVYDPHMPSMADLTRSRDFVKIIREAVGDKADLLFGTHGQFSTSGAKRLASYIEPYAPLWFEEPTPPEMPEQMAEVARSTTIPVSTGERLCTKYEFARVLQCGAASILQPNLGRVGGIWEAKKIAALAEVHYAHIAPHLYCGPIVGAANIQLAASIPNFLILESIKDWSGIHSDLLTTPITWEQGYVIPSKEPGIGVNLNENYARSLPYNDKQVHLEMQNKPYDALKDTLFAGGS